MSWMSNRYKINEFFTSIQGEGVWSGTMMTFIRFSGCNLSCSWCDTNHEQGSLLHIEQVKARIKEELVEPKIVCFTGGEPLMQVDSALCTELFKLGVSGIHIETNGTLPFRYRRPDGEKFGYAFWITWSPKTVVSAHDYAGPHPDEMKIVLPGNGWRSKDLDQMMTTADELGMEAGVRFLQPMDCEERNLSQQRVLEEIRRNGRWRIGLQIHKILKLK